MRVWIGRVLGLALVLVGTAIIGSGLYSAANAEGGDLDPRVYAAASLLWAFLGFAIAAIGLALLRRRESAAGR